jgi:hypothetical protein
MLRQPSHSWLLKTQRRASRASNLMSASAALTGSVPEQHSDRLQAGELCFACLIGLLFGDPRQRPANRAPSTAGACNAEASRSHSGGWGQFYLGAPGNWVSFQSALTPFAVIARTLKAVAAVIVSSTNGAGDQ